MQLLQENLLRRARPDHKVYKRSIWAGGVSEASRCSTESSKARRLLFDFDFLTGFYGTGFDAQILKSQLEVYTVMFEEGDNISLQE